eukprot:m.139016 g.139016  ORF g.139016 m.139016 type:complete len:490 (+) comp13162_c4_seq1:61-1530(+)
MIPLFVVAVVAVWAGNFVEHKWFFVANALTPGYKDGEFGIDKSVEEIAAALAEAECIQSQTQQTLKEEEKEEEEDLQNNIKNQNNNKNTSSSMRCIESIDVVGSDQRVRREEISTFESFTPSSRMMNNPLEYGLRIQRRGSGGVGAFVTKVANPMRTFSVYEPRDHGTCSGDVDARTHVSESAKRYGCEFATNAGFFNTQTGFCYGNIVSDGRLVKNSTFKNANFGIRSDGTVEVGYVSNVYGKDSDETMPPPFLQLVAGALWIVRNGRSYVWESLYVEDVSIQETGSWSYFASVRSARTGIGYNELGHLVIVQHDGKTNQGGVSLYELAQLMIEEGVVNGINLDGGGSSVSVINGSVSSFPSDECKSWECECSIPPDECEQECQRYTCERSVTTLLCVHPPRNPLERNGCLSASDCNEEEDCLEGVCVSNSSPSKSKTFTASTSSAIILGICLFATWMYIFIKNCNNSTKTKGIGSVTEPIAIMESGL